MAAAACGNHECVKLLLDQEAGMQDDEGMTALMRAAKNGKKDCVILLLEKEKGMVDKDGHNARWYAKGECKDILKKEEECVCKNLFDAVHSDCETHCEKFANQVK